MSAETVPTLRFPGNTAAWSPKRIGDLIERVSTSVSVNPTELYREIGIRSHGKGIFHKPATTGAEIGEKRVFSVQSDALVFNIVFAWERAVAITSPKDFGFIASHRFPMFRAKSGRASLAFLRQFFLTGRGKQILEIASPGGAGRNRTLNQQELLDLKIAAPSLGEQERIATAIGAVDRKIALLRDKRDALERFKAGTMDRIFRREIRFRKDDGSAFPDWSSATLGKIATFTKGRGISKDDVDDAGPTPCIRYGEIYTLYREKITSVASRTSSPTKGLLMSRKGDVIIPASGETAVDMARACCVLLDGVAIGGDINVIRTTLNGEFLAYFLTHARRREIARLAQGNSVVHLYGEHLKGVPVSIPHPDEQAKIAAALSAMDAKIDAVAAQIECMETFRRGLIQGLFP